MKQTTFEAQAFLEAVQFFRQEKGHYGSWEMTTGDEVQVLWASELWILSHLCDRGQGHIMKVAQIEDVVSKAFP
jgi:hypothetical protein